MKQVQQRKFGTAFWFVFMFCFLFFNGNLQAQVQIGGDLDGLTAGDQLGTEISCSADGKRIALVSLSGNYIKIYQETGGIWSQIGADILIEPGSLAIDLSSDGKRLAIGEPTYLIGTPYPHTIKGRVRVLEENGGNWLQIGADITFHGGHIWWGFGTSVSFSGDGKTLAIGHPGAENTSAFGFAGKVFIYEESAGSWGLVQEIDGQVAFGALGYNVILSNDGNRMVAGGGNGIELYEQNGGVWNLMTYVDTHFPSNHALSLSGDGKRIALGDLDDDSNINNGGKVSIYEESSGVLTQIGLDIFGSESNEKLGAAVSLSDDGKYIAIGATEAHPCGKGYVSLYEEVGGNWTVINNKIEGIAYKDQFGSSVAISANGFRVAIGGPKNDGNGNNAGHTRVFDLTSASGTGPNSSHITLLNQTEVDAFASCQNIVEGDLAIHGTDITNLNALIGLEEVIGDVLISQNGLVDLSGLENLTSIGGGLSIVQNGDLVNLSGLDNLTEIGENFTISNNAVLQNLNGLDALKNIENNLTISGNPLLNSLSGMDNMLSVGSMCTIVTNPNLTDCCPIQPLLSSGVGGMIFIFFNNTGCESTMGINNACTASSNLLGNFNNSPSSITNFQNTILEAYPNPANDAVNIQVKNLSETSFLTILDHLGRVALQQEVEVGSSTILLQLKELGLSRGIYLIHLPVGDQLITKRLVVIE